MHTDVLIIGGGLSGTHLAWQLHKEGRSFIIMDKGWRTSASAAAAGIINPVTGRRYVTTWLIDELLTVAKTTYQELGIFLGADFLSSTQLIDFFTTPQMRNAFVERLLEDDTYLRSYPDQNRFNPSFKYDFGCGESGPVQVVDTALLLSRWKDWCIKKERWLEQEFKEAEVVVAKNSVSYKDITAQQLIFCDGISSATNQWFSRLPFSANKGEALWIACPGLPRDHVFKKGMMLVPVGDDDLFWVGSNYQWEFEDDQPSEAFLKSTTALLTNWLKLPFTVTGHKAAIRPATLERRPFVGFHPAAVNVGLLNGMGTKGASLAPYFARQLVQHIVHGSPLLPEADVHRFSRLLLK